ncbi:MAG: tetratricopeptide repeat protein [Promethearchaeota archaeon]
MKLYSNCLYSNETNPSISLCFLISSIEVLAQKYIEINENWENYSHLGFYNSLKKILKKIEDEDLKEKIFLEIGQKYIKETFQVKARYSNFLLRFVGLEFRLVEDSNDILFKEVVGDYYKLRSQYMHTGTEILTRDYNSPIIFNQTRKGKLKTFNEGSRLDIKYLPSFQFLIKLIKSSILNFLDYLYNNRNDEQDKQKYSPLDKRPRGMIEVTAKRNILAGTAVFGEQIHMKKQYIHIYERNEKIKQYSKEKNFEQLINEYTRILDKIKDSGDNERIILCYHNLGSNYLENKNLEPAFINLMEAKKISEENNLDNYKHSINYNLACYYSLKNDLENASDFLSKAIIDPQLKETAKTDKDLENLRNDARFNSLFD